MIRSQQYAQEISDRIRLLLGNPVLAFKGLDGQDNYFSNCHGTAAYVLGLEERFKKWSRFPGDFLHAEGRRPCLVDGNLMKTFVENECIQLHEGYEFGDLAVMWSPAGRANKNKYDLNLKEAMFRHTSIVINPKTELVFHQVETAGHFEMATIDTYIVERFPRFRKRGKNLFVDFYRVKDLG